MFRKIHSNRDPRDTLLSELRKEFSTYFTAAGNCFRSILQRHPRFSFGSMVFLMTASIIVSFTVLRHHEPPKTKPVRAKISPVQDGLSQIIQAGEKLRTTLQLKRLVDSLSERKTLTAKDSLVLDSALDRLQSIQKTIK
jgi:hypothetical protein